MERGAHCVYACGAVAMGAQWAAFIIFHRREPCFEFFTIRGLGVGRSSVGRGCSVGGGGVKGVHGRGCNQAAIKDRVVSRREEVLHGLGGGVVIKACELRMVFD